MKSTKGIYIDTDSSSSKHLSDNLIKDKEFIQKLKDYQKAMYHNFSVDESINLKGDNWHNALGNVDIKDMHINIDGDVELYVTDVYDFNANERRGAAAVGRNRQEKGEIIPYFIIYRVIISRKDYDRIIR